MKLYTFLSDGAERLGAEHADGSMIDLAAASGGDARFASMLALIEAGEAGLDEARRLIENPRDDARRAMAGITLAAPIPRPSKLRGCSVFEQHLRQSAEGAARRLAADAPDPEAAYGQIRVAMGLDKIPSPGWAITPAYYYMDVATVVGHDSRVEWPAYSNWIDYELELVAVIGQRGKDIAAGDAGRHIFGYTMINDLSARDAQLKAMATGLGVGKGKDFDGSNPMGPCIVTADEIADPYALKARIVVDGEEWSATSGQGAQFRFGDCLEYASAGQTIHPGELISTGTLPNGSSMEIQRELSRGSTVEFEVEAIGTLRVHIAA